MLRHDEITLLSDLIATRYWHIIDNQKKISATIKEDLLNLVATSQLAYSERDILTQAVMALEFINNKKNILTFTTNTDLPLTPRDKAFKLTLKLAKIDAYNYLDHDDFLDLGQNIITTAQQILQRNLFTLSNGSKRPSIDDITNIHEHFTSAIRTFATINNQSNLTIIKAQQAAKRALRSLVTEICIAFNISENYLQQQEKLLPPKSNFIITKIFFNHDLIHVNTHCHTSHLKNLIIAKNDFYQATKNPAFYALTSRHFCLRSANLITIYNLNAKKTLSKQPIKAQELALSIDGGITTLNNLLLPKLIDLQSEDENNAPSNPLPLPYILLNLLPEHEHVTMLATRNALDYVAATTNQINDIYLDFYPIYFNLNPNNLRSLSAKKEVALNTRAYNKFTSMCFLQIEESLKNYIIENSADNSALNFKFQRLTAILKSLDAKQDHQALLRLIQENESTLQEKYRNLQRLKLQHHITVPVIEQLLDVKQDKAAKAKNQQLYADFINLPEVIYLNKHIENIYFTLTQANKMLMHLRKKYFTENQQQIATLFTEILSKTPDQTKQNIIAVVKAFLMFNHLFSQPYHYNILTLSTKVPIWGKMISYFYQDQLTLLDFNLSQTLPQVIKSLNIIANTKVILHHCCENGLDTTGLSEINANAAAIYLDTKKEQVIIDHDNKEEHSLFQQIVQQELYLSTSNETAGQHRPPKRLNFINFNTTKPDNIYCLIHKQAELYTEKYSSSNITTKLKIIFSLIFNFILTLIKFIVGTIFILLLPVISIAQNIYHTFHQLNQKYNPKSTDNKTLKAGYNLLRQPKIKDIEQKTLKDADKSVTFTYQQDSRSNKPTPARSIPAVPASTRERATEKYK